VIAVVYVQVNAIHENAEVFDSKAEGVFKYLQVG